MLPCENSSNASYDLTNGTFPDYVTLATNADDLESGASCSVKQYNGTVQDCQSFIDILESSDHQSRIYSAECSDLVFDQSVVLDSIVTQYGLTCDRQIIKNIIGAVYMVGLMVGSFGFGILSDAIGRKKALMVGLVLTSTSGVLGAFMPNEVLFGIMRFLSGVGAKGLFMIAFVLSVEFTGQKYSAYLGVAIQIPFALGEMVVGFQAYFIRNWVYLQLAAYAPIILGCLLWFPLPESPRWLLSKNQANQARKITQIGAKTNNVPLSDDLLHSEKPYEDQTSLNVLDTLRPFPILTRSLNLWFQWFCVTFCYYGLAFGSTELLGDVHLNYFLSAFIEIPGYVFAMLVMDCWGRRPILAFCQLVAGLGCILAGLLAGNEDLAILQVCFALIGKMMSSASFAIVYQFTAELFPTAIRTTAVGNCSAIARFGAVFALLADAMADIWTPLPMVLMGALAVCAGFLATFLPETVGLPLPQSVQEALDISERADKRGLCTFTCANTEE